ncbi:hypothetical protein GOV04_04050 [Candidatus Woesearchaeota archaeon]|nr:hypothetical protein [Candidatus Woesearchaeota archaeon]
MIKKIIERILRDKKIKPFEYNFHTPEQNINFSQIKNIEGDYLIIDNKGREKEIPLEDINKITNKDKTIWEKKS